MFYNEALSFDAYHKKASLAVAKLYVEKGDLTSAQAQCQSVIKTDINSEEATMMMGEIMFRNNDYDAALFQFNQLLKKNPNNFKALLQLIDMLRRSGKLMEAESLFATVEKNNFKIGLRPGYHYCKGLFHR